MQSSAELERRLHGYTKEKRDGVVGASHDLVESMLLEQGYVRVLLDGHADKKFVRKEGTQISEFHEKSTEFYSYAQGDAGMILSTLNEYSQKVDGRRGMFFLDILPALAAGATIGTFSSLNWDKGIGMAAGIVVSYLCYKKVREPLTQRVKERERQAAISQLSSRLEYARGTQAIRAALAQYQ